jgi:hypothetical protein
MVTKTQKTAAASCSETSVTLSQHDATSQKICALITTALRTLNIAFYLGIFNLFIPVRNQFKYNISQTHPYVVRLTVVVQKQYVLHIMIVGL